MWYKIAKANEGESIKNDSTSEKWIKLGENSKISQIAEKAIPSNDMRVSFDGAVKVTDEKNNVSYLAIYAGGMNGGKLIDKWGKYLDCIKDILKNFDDSWLVDLNNDCCDDVWYLTVGFRF